jgi:predicted enzyme related to lactoylglutathione lyase
MKTESFPKMHVSLYVKDIEETANFYTKFFGKDVEKCGQVMSSFILKIRH